MNDGGGNGPNGADSGRESEEAGALGVWLEVIRTIVYALLIAVLVRTFAFEPFNIPSGSMVPTLLEGDYLFVSKYSYGYSEYSFPFGIVPIEGRVLSDRPARGDVVVFRQPPRPDVDFIKRVVGLPGDRIQVVSGILHINGEPVSRRRIDDFVTPRGTRYRQYVETLPNGAQHRILETSGDRGNLDETPVYTVPAGHYFMMGDNRDNSNDSRVMSVVGYVPHKNLIGRAEVLFWSVDESVSIFMPWTWPTGIRYSRLLDGVD